MFEAYLDAGSNYTFLFPCSKLEQNMLSTRKMSDIFLKIKDRPSNNSDYYGFEGSQREDQGSGQMCILGPEGDAISLVSTINTPYVIITYVNTEVHFLVDFHGVIASFTPR